MNNKMHLAINSIYYLFRGEHKLVNTKKPSKPATAAFLLHIVDNMKDSKVDAALKDYETSNLDSRANESFKNIADCLLCRKYYPCPKGNYARLEKNEEVLKAFMARYRRNPIEIMTITKQFCDRLIGDVGRESLAYEKIGHVILEMIDQDTDIPDEYPLYICPGVRSISKRELHSRITGKCTMEFYPLLAGVMYYVFEKGGCEAAGFETIGYWRNMGFVKENDMYSQVSFEFNMPSEDDVSDDELLKKFGSYVRKNKELIENKKLDILGSEQDFAGLYVGSNLSYMDGSVKNIISGNSSYEQLKIMEAFSPFSIITGESGYGKSMLIKSMLHDASVEYLQALRDNRVSVLVSLCAYDTSKIEFVDFVYESIKSVYDEITYQEYKKLLATGRMRLFMDALDELSSVSRVKTADEIVDFIKTYPKNSYILTSRNVRALVCFDIGKVEHVTYSIEPFSEMQANELIDNWVIGRDLTEDEIKVKKNKFRNRIIRNLSMKALITKPMLLSIMLSVYFDDDSRFDSKGMLYKSIFNIIYRRRLKKTLPGGGFNTALSKKELKDFFAELSALCWYDDVQTLEAEELGKYIKQIMRDNSIDEEAGEVIKDFSEELGLLIKEGDYYSFIHSSFRDYFAAEYFCSNKCNEKWNVSAILESERDSREVAQFMYDINEEICSKLVLQKLNDIYDGWSGRDEDYDAFVKYMKESYTEYKVLSPRRVKYYMDNGWYNELYGNSEYRSAMMTLVHIMLNDRVETQKVYEDDMVTGYSGYDSSLCEALGVCVKGHEDQLNDLSGCIVAECAHDIEPEYIEKEIYESELYGTDYDEDGMPLLYGDKLVVAEELPNDGYGFTIRTRNLELIDGEGELLESIKKVLMDKNVCEPFATFDRLKVLRYDLSHEADEDDEVVFGLRG